MDHTWSLQEAIAYYGGQGAPGQQAALVALLREIQEENGGVLPEAALAEVAAAYRIKETFLTALVGRYPSLRPAGAPHRLELCGGPNCARQGAAALRAWVEETWRVRPGGISEAGGFSYRVAGCMKHCGRGPNLRWDGQVYEGAGPELLERLIRSGH